LQNSAEIIMDFLFAARNIKGKQFGNEPGATSYLQLPENVSAAKPLHGVEMKAWLSAVMRAATWGRDARTGRARGDILIFVHGYNNSPETVLTRHRLLRAGLQQQGFKGAVVSYDWPAAASTLNYLEDRHDAKKTAMQLVSDGIALLADRQQPDCTINVHLLAHSMGALVAREAFDDADDVRLTQQSWMLSQLILLAGDISQNSLTLGHAKSQAFYNHCLRLTNYFSRHDFALKISNAKRVGLAPRVGRVGLPEQAHSKAVDVDCTDYFAAMKSDAALAKAEQPDGIDDHGHSWYFGNQRFMRDLFETLRGDFDRTEVPTREMIQGKLRLRVG
jgi:esterase/lipase superfamily enzyme